MELNRILDWVSFNGNLSSLKKAFLDRLRRVQKSTKKISGSFRGHKNSALNPALTKTAFRLFDVAAQKNYSGVLLHPTFTLWLSIADTLSRENWKNTHPGWSALASHLQEFAISQAVALSLPHQAAVLADRLGHVHLQGSGCYLDFGASMALQPILLRHQSGHLEAARINENFLTRIPSRAIAQKKSTGPLKTLPLLHGKIEVDACNGLVLNQNKVTDHRIGLETEGRHICFRETLEKALAQMRRIHPGAYAEIFHLIRLIIPLATPEGMTSASSTSREFPGALMLSHCDDPLVQAETLIHEGAHAKLNLLVENTPLLLNDNAALYYSPLKNFPRPLSYVLFGAHAFLNVVDYLIRYLESEGRGLAPRRRSEVELYAARRAYEVALEFEACGQYGRFTPEGKEFYLHSQQELGKLTQKIAFFNPDNIRQAREKVDVHRKENTLYPSLLFRSKKSFTQTDMKKIPAGAF